MHGLPASRRGRGLAFQAAYQARSRLSSLKMEFDAAKIDLARTYFAVGFVKILDLGNKAHAKFITLGVSALWLAWDVALIMRFMPAGHLLFFASSKKSKQKKGDPDVQVCFADFPHSVSFFRRVRTSRTSCAVGQAHTFFRKKDAPFGWT